MKHTASLFVLTGLVMLAVGSPGSGSNRQPQSPSVLPGQVKQITGENRCGCSSRDYFEKLVEYAEQNDKEAFSKALTAGLLSETCTVFKNRETVYITDTALFSGLVKVRRKGETEEYWTNVGAVK